MPLPFCSIRVQYSGPPGSAIAEISSIEQKGDLVIDSRVTNEADWLGMSGAHPWHLDEETESVLILTNMGDRECRMGFQVQAGGVHYHLIDLKLAAHEIRAIDIRKLRDAQKPDFQGNLIPAAAGSVIWARMEDVPVTGRLVVMQRHKGLASNYTCGTGCQCPTNFVSLAVTCTGHPILVAQTDQHFSTETRRDCNNLSFYYDETNSSRWTSAHPEFASVNTTDHKGRATGVSGGTTTIVAQFTSTNYYYVPYSGCHTQVVTHAGNRECVVRMPTFVSVISNSCGTLTCNIGGVLFSTNDRVLRYQVQDASKAPIGIAGMTISEYNSNYCDNGCNSLMPTSGSWLTDINGSMPSNNPDYISTCSLTCYNGENCTASWNQRFDVYMNSQGFSVSVINGLLQGSKNLNSTSCTSCPTVTPVP